MTELYPSHVPPEKAFLVAAHVRGSRPLLPVDDSLKELALLSSTAGMEVVGQAVQNIQRIDPSTFIGSGKVEEIRDTADQTGAQVIIFDDELSPRHQRELEQRFGDGIKVLDRSALILDIFAQHARTREGSLQVELAQYEYRLPRLTRQWTHLARQAGGSTRGGVSGVGLRGPGETQLEVDRREIGRIIARLKRDLEHVRQHRSRHRMQRTRAGIPVIALVGYTNAGKSTLLKALTQADVYIADQLFATLDPTTRRLALPSGKEALFSDTVGFIQKLPTTLIAAFRATLEEVSEANLLLHVVDASHPNVLQHIEVVEDTLAEIDVPSIPRLLVWNKIDRIDPQALPEIELHSYAAQIAISAQKHIGIDLLLAAAETTLSSSLRDVHLLIPYDQGQMLSALYDTANVSTRENTPEGISVRVLLSPVQMSRFQAYVISETK